MPEVSVGCRITPSANPTYGTTELQADGGDTRAVDSVRNSPARRASGLGIRAVGGTEIAPAAWRDHDGIRIFRIPSIPEPGTGAPPGHPEGHFGFWLA